MFSRIRILFVITLILSTFTFAQEVPDKESKVEHIGFIFSSDNILLELNDYNGGIGMKMMLPNFSLRLMADFGYSNSTEIISGDLGIAIEKRLRDGRISPYIGGGFMGGVEHETAEIDADNWTKQLTVPLQVSGFLGVEVFLLEFLSIFAEYNVAVKLNGVTTSQNVDGTITDSANWNWDIGTGLGNSGRLGLVIYLDDVVRIEKD